MIAFTENAGGESPLSRIEKRARIYADIRGELTSVITQLSAQIDDLTRTRLPLIKKLVARAAAQHTELEAAILAAPGLFEKPRTAVFHGVKVGFRKNEGRIEFDDPDFVVEKIHELLDPPELFLRVTTQPNKEALASLPALELKRLGCRLVDTTDTVVIKPVDSDIDKKINTLLKDAIDPESASIPTSARPPSARESRRG